MQNGLVESFNGRMREKCLNAHLFPSLRHACRLIAAWRNDYNHNRPHPSLDGLTPREYHQRSRVDQTMSRANSYTRTFRGAGRLLSGKLRLSLASPGLHAQPASSTQSVMPEPAPDSGVVSEGCGGLGL
jgi:hypothetical protein